MMQVFTGLLEQIIKIEKKQINYTSGFKSSEITGISVNSVGDVYVAGNVVKIKKIILLIGKR